MKETVFTGSACAIITPFDETGKLDLKALKRQIDFQIDNGTKALVVCGTTGEASTLNLRERRQMIKSAVRFADGRVPVIAGTGSNCTQTAVRLSEAAELSGVDALLVVTPYYNKCSQEGLVGHYGYIAERTELPIIVYNVPSRTGVDIKPETYLELSKIENIVATKEANGNISALAETMSLCGDELNIYCGNDDQTAAFTAMGAKGVVSVMANILPAETAELAESGIIGNIGRSVQLQLKYLELCKCLFCDVNPIPVKEAMYLLGYDSGVTRLPLTRTKRANREKIELTLKKYGLLNS